MEETLSNDLPAISGNIDDKQLNCSNPEQGGDSDSEHGATSPTSSYSRFHHTFKLTFNVHLQGSFRRLRLLFIILY